LYNFDNEDGQAPIIYYPPSEGEGSDTLAR